MDLHVGAGAFCSLYRCFWLVSVVIWGTRLVEKLASRQVGMLEIQKVGMLESRKVGKLV